MTEVKLKFKGILPHLYRYFSFRLQGENIDRTQNGNPVFVSIPNGKYTATAWLRSRPKKVWSQPINVLCAFDCSPKILSATITSSCQPVIISSHIVVQGCTPHVISAIVVEAPTPPNILTQPVAKTFTEGENVTLSVNASNFTTISWKKVGSNAVVGTGQNLTITNANQSHEGSYYAIVSNNVASVESNRVFVIMQINNTAVSYKQDNDGWPLIDVSGNVLRYRFRVSINTTNRTVTDLDADYLTAPGLQTSYRIDEGLWKNGQINNLAVPTHMLGRELQVQKRIFNPNDSTKDWTEAFEATVYFE